jgi:Rrf2 family nitric oxide-sensitive transcriptional repressor
VQLTLHADYSLRVLVYLAERPNHLASTQEISEAYGISRHHLVRVMHTLAAGGFVRVMTGRKGGVALAQPAAAISIGQVIRSAEPSFRIVECFDPTTNQCPIAPVCRLRGMLHEALAAFLAVLDGHTLADVVQMPKARRLSLFFLTSANAARQPDPGPP